MQIAINTITVPERLRRDYGGPSFDELKLSLHEFGLIQPIMVTPDRLLVAGGRRLAAATSLGWLLIDVFVKEGGGQIRQWQMEVEENTQRLAMSWQERALAIARIHHALVAENTSSSWTIRATGKECGTDICTITRALRIAKALNDNDKEILRATSFIDANRILVRREAEKLAKFMNERDRDRRVLTAQNLGIATFNELPHPISQRELADLIGGNGSDDELPGVTGEGLVPPPEPRITTIAITPYYHVGDFREHLSGLGPQVFDHCVTDIPYGIHMDSLESMADMELVVEQHDRDENIALFEPFLRHTYRVLRPGGYCVFWFDITHFELLRNLADRVGFKVQPWPLIWCKTSACKNEAARQNWTKATEFAMVCRKGLASLITPQAKNFVLAAQGEDNAIYNHPFAKPYAVWKFIYDAIALPGQTILDPYAGEGSSTLAAIRCGLQPYTIEISDVHQHRALQHVQQLYREQFRGRVQFV